MLKKKICMVGEFGVGKTSLVRRFVDSIFYERYLTTIGVKVDRKDVIVGGKSVRLMLWDLAGEDDLAQLNVSHLRAAHGYILVADGCRAATLEKAVELHQRITQVLGPLPLVMAVNKADLRDQWEVQSARMAEYGWPTFETPALRPAAESKRCSCHWARHSSAITQRARLRTSEPLSAVRLVSRARLCRV
jgi:small GTP-binding protein